MANIQFFKLYQVRYIVDFVKKLYEEDRQTREQEYLNSEEFKTDFEAYKKDNKRYADMLEDKAKLLVDYDKHAELLDTLTKLIGDKQSAISVIRILRSPSYYLTDSEYKAADVKIDRLEPTDTKELSNYYGKDYALDENTKEDLEKRLDEIIEDRIKDRFLNETQNRASIYRNFIPKIRAIVTSMEACDESKAVEIVLEKLPYDEVNKVVVKDDFYTGSWPIDDDASCKCECDC